MTAQEQIAKLESLLDRIRRNASLPRTAAPVVAASAPAAAPPAPPQTPPPVAAAPPPVPVTPVPVAVAQVQELDEPIPDIEDLDMADVEVVELAVEESSVVESEDEAPDTLDEPIPESAPRPAAALAGGADVAEPEAPIKTPPPESGRQIVAPVIHDDAREADLTGGGDVDSLLEADLSGGPISRAPAADGPTMEQLGATVELQGADAPAAALELDAGPAPSPAAVPADELEIDLPKQGFAGGYEAQLAPPSGAAADLRSLEASPPPPPVESFAPPVQTAPPPEPPRAPAGPTIVERPPLEARAAEMIAAAPAKTPETFLDLLDVSLALRP